MSTRKMRFFADCVGWPRNDADGLSEIVDNEMEVSRKTFMKHTDMVDRVELETALGYDRRKPKELQIKDDWSVRYARSTHHGERIYLMVHSAIEYVFK